MNKPLVRILTLIVLITFCSISMLADGGGIPPLCWPSQPCQNNVSRVSNVSTVAR